MTSLSAAASPYSKERKQLVETVIFFVLILEYLESVLRLGCDKFVLTPDPTSCFESVPKDSQYKRPRGSGSAWKMNELMNLSLH